MIKEDIVKTRIEAEGFKKVQTDILAIQKTLAEYSEEVKELKYQKSLLVAAGKTESDEYKNLTKRIKEVTNKINTEKVSLEKLNASLNMTQMSHNQLKKRAEELKRELNNTSKSINPEKWEQLHSQLKQVEAQIDKVKIGMRNASNEVKVAPSFWSNTFSKVKNYMPAFSISSTLMSGWNQMRSAISGSVSDFRSYDEALVDAQKTTDTTKQEIIDISESLKKIDTRTSQNELLGLGRVAGKLGIKGKEDIEGFVRSADKINVALTEDLGGDTEEAINQIGKLVDIFGLKDKFGIEDSMLRVASAINEAGASSTANEGYIVEFSKRVAGIAPNANVSLQSIVGLSATLDKNGQQAETSATVYGQVITKMFQEPAKFAKLAGQPIKEFTNLIKTDANAAFVLLLKGLKGNEGGMTEIVNNLDDVNLRGQRGIQVMGTLVDKVGDLEKQQAMANAAFADGKSILDEFEKKNTSSEAIHEKKLKSIRDESVAIGQLLNPASESLLDVQLKLYQIIGRLIGVIIQSKGVIIPLVAAITTHIAITKIWTKWAAVKQALLVANNAETLRAVIAIKAKTIAERAGTAAGALYSAVTLLIAGNTKRAAAALRLFNMTLKISPLGWAAAAIGVVVGALLLLRKRTDDVSTSTRNMNAIQAQAKEATAGETSKLTALYNIVTDLNKSESIRRGAMIALQKLIPNGVKLINDETIANGNAKKAVDAYCKSLVIKAKLSAVEGKISEIETKRINANQSSENFKPHFGQQVVAGLLTNLGLYAKSWEYTNGIIDKNRTTFMADLEKQDTEMKAYLESLTSESLAIDGAFELDEPDTGGSGGSGGGADKDKKKWALDQDAKFMAEKIALRQKLNTGEIATEEEFNRQLLTIEIAALERRIAINKEKGTDLQELQNQVAEKKYQQIKTDQARSNQLLAASMEGGKNPELQQQIDLENSNYEKRLKDLELFGVRRENMTQEQLAAITNLERIHGENLRYIYIGELQKQFAQESAANERTLTKLKTDREAALSQADTFEKKKEMVRAMYGDQTANRLRSEKAALKLIRAKYNEQEAAETKESLEVLVALYENMVAELETTLSQADLSGMTNDERGAMQKMIDDLKKQIAALKGDKISGDQAGYGDDLDILGFSKKQWGDLFANLEDGKLSMEDWGDAIGMIGGAMANAFSSVSNLMGAIEQRQFKTYEKTANKKKKLLEQQKRSGLITEEAYGSKVQAIDEETERKKEDMDRKQAVRDKMNAVFQSLISTAVAVTMSLPNVALAAIVAALGAIQTAAILATPLPGAEAGGMFNVQREQDGRQFYAEFSPSRRGYVDRPTVLVGENGPEYVIPSKMLANPEVSGFVNTLEAARLRGNFRNPLGYSTLPGRASGGYLGNATASNAGSSTESSFARASQSDDVLRRNVEVMEKMLDRLERPIPAYLRKYGQGGLYDSMQRDTLIRKQL